ncbi:MAG: trehalose-6-phosphate synthase [Planctomycetes bacterium RIFCSPHIGHO2_12_FULL_52_36]|nr:MAG: trehalose-6-phosphate synthase [Planctomycetes bacterium RIFCSPHIGHO2_02_FULL_52_58]OHB93749.1 MAG: trehalose-6-phosphate synthase [Planctomycetes bacterium RIFCSPHIGHO2_12_FULL_52_36]
MVSNREPYVHTFQGEEIKCGMPASGVTMALDPVMQSCGGIWIAHGSGDADKEVVDAHNHIQVPPEESRYTLRRVWLTKEEEAGYYYGFSNEALWPLCHVVYTRPTFKSADWETYKKVNELFSRTVLEEIGDKKAFVFIQDYHFALLSRLIREKNPNCILSQFWHIPWPNPEAFRICPWKEEILHGLLGNDLLGFHIRYHCMNFLETVDRMIEARTDYEKFEIIKGGKSTRVRPFPISIDFDEASSRGQSQEVEIEMRRLRKTLGLGGQIVGLGVDRIDYTKGIPERFRAIDLFFEKYPQYKGKVKFIQAGPLSRIHIQQYKDLNEELTRLMVEINFKYERGRWKPIQFHRSNFGKKELMALYRLADFCVVSSLHDGMNLVAKEYVASRADNTGVLILSQFTGAARELESALLVNPYDVDGLAENIRLAIEMTEGEKQKRMSKMREVVQKNNIYRWTGKVLSELLRFEFPEG